MNVYYGDCSIRLKNMEEKRLIYGRLKHEPCVHVIHTARINSI